MGLLFRFIVTILCIIYVYGSSYANTNNLPDYFASNFTAATFFLAGPDTDGDGIDDLDDLDADNDGILNSDELTCPATADQLIFANHWAAGVDPISTAASPPTVFSGNTVTLERRDPMNIIKVEPGGTGINPFNGRNSYKIRQTSVANGSSEHIFKFSNPVSNLVMAVIDVDASDVNAYVDNVIYNGYYQGEIYSIKPSDVFSGSANTFNIGQNSFTGTGVTATYPEGATQVTFPVPIDSVVITYFNTGTNPVDNQAISFQTNFSFCEVLDTDNDGIPDYLDLDSDNDGCPDAIEGGGGFSVSDIQNDMLTGGVDANGIPVAATAAGQNVGSSQINTQQADACQDADFDGNADVNDLDDDNDGILDTQELCGTDPLTITTSDINLSINLDQYSNEITWTIDSPSGTVASGGPYTTAQANTTVTDVINVSENGAYTFTIFDTYGDGLQGNTYTLSGTDFATITTAFTNQGVTNTPVSQSETFNITSVVNSPFTCLADDPSADSDNDGIANYQDADFCTLNANGVCTTLDDDGDGLINSFDLDRDGDGCPDALEGAGNFTFADLQNDTLSGGVDNDGIPVTATASGQGVNTSNDPTQTAAACTTIAENDINQTPQDIDVAGNILTNDTDPTGDNQTVQSATGLDASGNPVVILLDGTPTDIYDENGVLAGTIALGTDGSYDFDPAPAFTGELPVEYVVVDDNGNTDPATLTIQVIPADSPTQNEPPVATDDTNTTLIDTDVAGNVILPNDTDPENDPLTLTAALADTDGDGLVDDVLTVGTPTPVYGTDDLGNTTLAGSITLNSDGTYNFNPAPAFTGDVPVDYTIVDGNGGSDDATLTITILPNNGNDSFANDDASVDNQGNTQSSNVITNDNDPEGDTQMVTGATASDNSPLTVDGTTANTLPSGGTLIVDANGNYTYQPEPNFIGTEVVSYVVCDNAPTPACDTATLYLTTLPVNSIASKDDYNNTPFETPVTADVSINDVDAENDNQSFALNGTNGGMNPADGTVTLNTDGSYTFIPATGFTGETAFDYEVCDDGAPILCDTATVYIEVLPTVNPETPQVIANPDANSVKLNETGTGNVLANDLDPDDLKPSVITPVTNLVVAGTDEAGNPVANAGTLTLNTDGSYTFIPATDFTGTVTQPYTICNAESPGVCDDTQLIIEVIPATENTTFANDDAAVTDAGVTVTSDISINDTDSELDTQTITDYLVDTNGDGIGDTAGTIGTPTTVGGTNDQGVFVANAGSLTLNSDGTYSFTPATGFVGNVNVPYTTCDDASSTVACADATLVITVQDANRDYGDGPVVYPTVWHRALTDDNNDNVPDGASDIWLGESVGFESAANNGNDQFDDAISFGSSPGEFPLLAEAGTSYDVELAVNSAKVDTVFYAMWIDWDEDGIYDDFYTGSQVTTGTGSENATVSIIAPAFIGNAVNVRVRADDSPFAPTDFGGGKTNGEAEDFQALVVLPVELTRFSGKASGCHVELNWHAATEENFSHYEIERSGDGQFFSTIENINGNGGPGTGVYYNLTDKQAGQLNYYRLKMVDLDGSFEYSKVINVTTDCAHDYKLELYPNPANRATGQLNLNFFSNSEDVQIQIADMLGRTVQRLSLEATTKEMNTVRFDISSLPSGTYSLKILGGFKESSKIFIIAND